MKSKKFSKCTICFIMLGIIAAANIFFLLLRCIQGDNVFMDFFARWQESAYLFHGINPYNAMDNSNVLDEIGRIDPGMITVPWAWLLGSIINPGFLSFDHAKIYGSIFYLITAIITSYVCYQYVTNNIFTDETSSKNRWAFMAVFIVLGQYCWVWSFLCGNQGALVCCFIVISLCIYKKHPVAAGILMTFAMIKPQIAGIFFITFLLLKEFKLVLTAFICGVISYLAIVIITGAGFFNLLIQTLNAGTSLDYVFFGLFNLLKYVGISTNIILLLDIAAGILYLLFITLKTRTIRPNNDLQIFMGTAIASTFWFYKQPHDYVILIIPCLILLERIYHSKDNDFLKYFLLLCSLLLVFYIQSILRRCLTIAIPTMTEQVAKEILMTLTCIYFMFVGYIDYYFLKQIHDNKLQ